MIFKGVVHRLGHLQLTWPVLITADHAFVEEAPRAEDVPHGRFIAVFMLLGLVSQRSILPFVGLSLFHWPHHSAPVSMFLFQWNIDALGHTFSAIFRCFRGARFGIAFRQKAFLISCCFVLSF